MILSIHFITSSELLACYQVLIHVTTRLIKKNSPKSKASSRNISKKKNKSIALDAV